jgi:hypothetical protein
LRRYSAAFIGANCPPGVVHQLQIIIQAVENAGLFVDVTVALKEKLGQAPLKKIFEKIQAT